MKNTKILTCMMALGLIGSNTPIHGMEPFVSLEEQLELEQYLEGKLTEERYIQLRMKLKKKYDEIRKEMRDQIDKRKTEYNRLKTENRSLTPHPEIEAEIKKHFLKIETGMADKDEIESTLHEIDILFPYLFEKEKKQVELNPKLKGLLARFKLRKEKKELSSEVTGPFTAAFSALGGGTVPKYSIPQLNYYLIDHILNQIGLTAEEEDRIKEIKNEMEKLEDIVTRAEDLPPEKYEHDLYYHLIAGFLPLEKLKKMAQHAEKRRDELSQRRTVNELRKAWAKMKAEKKEKEVAGPSRGEEPVVQPVVQPVAKPVVQPSRPEPFFTDANLGQPIPEGISITTLEEGTPIQKDDWIAYRESKTSEPILTKVEKIDYHPKKTYFIWYWKEGIKYIVNISQRRQEKHQYLSTFESTGPSQKKEIGR